MSHGRDPPRSAGPAARQLAATHTKNGAQEAEGHPRRSSHERRHGLEQRLSQLDRRREPAEPAGRRGAGAAGRASSWHARRHGADDHLRRPAARAARRGVGGQRPAADGAAGRGRAPGHLRVAGADQGQEAAQALPGRHDAAGGAAVRRGA